MIRFVARSCTKQYVMDNGISVDFLSPHVLVINATTRTSQSNSDLHSKELNCINKSNHGYSEEYVERYLS